MGNAQFPRPLVGLLLAVAMIVCGCAPQENVVEFGRGSGFTYMHWTDQWAAKSDGLVRYTKNGPSPLSQLEATESTIEFRISAEQFEELVKAVRPIREGLSDKLDTSCFAPDGGGYVVRGSSPLGHWEWQSGRGCNLKRRSDTLRAVGEAESLLQHWMKSSQLRPKESARHRPIH